MMEATQTPGTPKMPRTPLEIIQSYIDTFEDMQKKKIATGQTADAASLEGKIRLLKTIKFDIEAEQEK